MSLLVNKTEATQHILKMQQMSLLPKYIKLINFWGGFFKCVFTMRVF